jgi:hypothetical protein
MCACVYACGYMCQAGWTQSLEAYQHFLFRQCSLAPSRYTFSTPTGDIGDGGDNGDNGSVVVVMSVTEREVCVEAIRDKVILDVTKSVANLLGR